MIERDLYLSPHSDYTRRIHALTALIGQYGIEYWKNRTLIFVACEYAAQGHQEAETSALQLLAKAFALEAAIVEICKRLEVDAKAIKKMAGCPDECVNTEELIAADSEFVKYYVKIFNDLTRNR